MVNGISPSAVIEGVGISEKGFSTIFPDLIHHLAGKDRVNIGVVSLLYKVNLDRSRSALLDTISKPGGIEKFLYFCGCALARVTSSQPCKMDITSHEKFLVTG
jgi:hypothetical protein